MEINKRLKETMIFLLNFDEGDNYTITADFIDTISQLNNDIITLLKMKRELTDNIEILHNVYNNLLSTLKESDKNA